VDAHLTVKIEVQTRPTTRRWSNLVAAFDDLSRVRGPHHRRAQRQEVLPVYVTDNMVDTSWVSLRRRGTSRDIPVAE